MQQLKVELRTIETGLQKKRSVEGGRRTEKGKIEKKEATPCVWRSRGVSGLDAT